MLFIYRERDPNRKGVVVQQPEVLEGLKRADIAAAIKKVRGHRK
ncbi:MAG: hypothetical protein AAB309_07115 [Deltaproteobacteria bacterium]